VTYFPEKWWQEERTAHADATVDFPVGDVHAEVDEGFVPSEDVLIGAVDESAIQIEKRGGQPDCLA
jgi:hypothetical protein